MSVNGNSVMRKFLIGLVLLLCALAILEGGAKSVSAATSCYGGAVSFTATSSGYTTPTYYTSSRCQDINIRFTNLNFNQQVCVIFVKHTSSCNYWTDISSGDTSWHVIAMNVLDGTAFQVFMLFGSYGNNINGYLAF